MTKLCKEFREASDYIFNWYSTQATVKEESLTDWFLYHMSLKLKVFRYQAFSRNAENKFYGADFELWILDKINNLAFRIQAKKLKKSGNHYDSISYPKRSKNQTNLLIASAGMKFIPAFLFYNNDSNSGHCERTKSGLILTDATSVKNIFLSGGETIVKRESIIKYSIPFECLFCCPLSEQKKNNSDDIKDVMRHYFPSVKANDNKGFIEELPNYIRDLINPQISQDIWLERYESQLSENVNCVAVLDLRNADSNIQ